MEQRLERIHNGVMKLQELHQNAVARISELEVENAALNAQLKACQQSKVSLAQTQLVEKIADQSVSSEAEKKQMKQRINELVREVDKCIALLNQ